MKFILTEMIEYLKTYREEVPSWLVNYRAGDFVPFSVIMNGRVGYYPGSGFDGHLIVLCNKSHSVHCFIQVDYGIYKEDLFRHVADPCCLRGYHSIGRVEWSEKDVYPNGKYSLKRYKKYSSIPKHWLAHHTKPYCFMEIFERNENRNDSWGAERLAVVFMGADGIATYNNLFVKNYYKAPWIFLLQDHGTGGNYDIFGKGGLLDEIVSRSSIKPDFVICADNTSIWDGYQRVYRAKSSDGGMRCISHRRYLHRLIVSDPWEDDLMGMRMKRNKRGSLCRLWQRIRGLFI